MSKTAPVAALVLRIVLGSLFIAHLYFKFEISPGGLEKWWSNLSASGYSSFELCYVISAEFAGALLLIPGIYTTWVSLYAMPMMVAATQFWFVRKGFYFTALGAELPFVWTAMLAVQALLGSGPYAVKVPVVRWKSALTRHA